MTDTTPKQAGYLALAPHLADDVQPWEIARMVEAVLEAVTPIISEETELKIMSEEGKLKWAADAIILSTKGVIAKKISKREQAARRLESANLGDAYWEGMRDAFDISEQIAKGELDE